MAQTRSRIITFSIAFIVWMFLSWKMSAASILAGVLIAAFIAVSSGHLFTECWEKWLQPKRYAYFALYIGVFLIECVKANIDVALRVIKPSMPINPGIVKVKTRLKSEAALTFLANSITLTPGTLCVDIEDTEGILYIHWIDVKDRDMVKASEHIVKKFETIIEKVFE